ncbi:MAG TPA: MBOAT family O-acyltransferase, partial [bacterium]|nr:MBOAT family O-acyltransferase [bacterium]
AGALAYTLQLYFDFSGYSEMAVALGLMLNIRLPINFDSPYKSRSIIEFWRRWHMTLSDFLKRYLYIPLGGNRRGETARMRNLMITMLLGGLWHGAGWTYVVWGGLHGLYLVLNNLKRRFGIRTPGAVSWAVTFLCVVAGWVIFRAANLRDAASILAAMSGLHGVVIPENLAKAVPAAASIGLKSGFVFIDKKSFLLVAALLPCALFLPNPHKIMERFKPTFLWGAVTAAVLFACLISLGGATEFLYFQF